MPSAPRSLKTPCIGTCSTIYGDSVCRGCSRFHHEIVHWNRYSAEQQDAVWSRLEQVIVTVLSSKVIVPDIDTFKARLQEERIRYPEKLDPMVWVNALLNQMDRTERHLADFGVFLRESFQNFSFSGLYELIQNEIFELSNAFYDQQIERAFRHQDLTPRREQKIKQPSEQDQNLGLIKTKDSKECSA